MLQLRLPWLWLGVGWLVVAGVCAGSLLPGSSMPSYIVLLGTAIGNEVLHGGAYFILMVWFAGFCERRRYGLVAVLLVALGVVLDVLQIGVPSRSFDLLDIASNAVGILVGLGTALWLLGGWCQRIERRLLA
ncbi:hypothetical protein [Candidatus Rariloculus sp.]|uniref:hypothetical protein n=1 Tax=Candidatus Rariloculus sp. TaxID=3101265 RepID=UPI003D14835F